MRGAFAALEQGKLVPYATAAFEAYWGRDLDISHDEVMAEIAEQAGLERQRFFATIETPACKARLRASTDELIARGGFGSPTLFVGDKMFFGNDRLPLVRAALGVSILRNPPTPRARNPPDERAGRLPRLGRDSTIHSNCVELRG